MWQYLQGQQSCHMVAVACMLYVAVTMQMMHMYEKKQCMLRLCLGHRRVIMAKQGACPALSLRCSPALQFRHVHTWAVMPQDARTVQRSWMRSCMS